MERTYFNLSFRLNNKVRHLIWFTSVEDNSDGVVVKEDRTVPFFSNQTDLVSFAECNDLPPIELSEQVLPDLDVLVRWLRMKKMKRARRVDPIMFLDAWNLFADVSKSIDGDFDSDQERTQKIYLKLFWGNNLPAVTPPGRCYIPLWSGRELKILYEVMSHGLLMIRTHIKQQ